MSEIAETGFWLGDTAHIHHVYCSPLAKWIIDFLKEDIDKQTYDFGCGLGNYLLALQGAGFTKLQGYEGDPPVKKVFDNIFQQDLTKPFVVPEKGNCIFLEVAEHVPAEFEEQLLNNVASACDGKLITSWAIRGQAGFGHINCLDNHEAIDRITRLGFKYSEEDSLGARGVIDESAPWFKNTLLIFEKKGD